MRKFHPRTPVISIHFVCDSRDCEISDKGLAKLTDALKSPGLTFLRLDFPGEQSISNVGLEKVCKTLSKLKNLTGISLDFSGEKSISNVGLETVCKTLSKLQNLTGISLNFSDNENIHGLTTLSNTLLQWSGLTSLGLSFSRIDISDKDLEDFSNALKSLQKLTSLNLDFSRMGDVKMSKIQNLGLTHLSKALLALSSSETITSIKLDFSGRSHISQSSFITLGEALLKFKNLTRLHLNFYEVPRLKELQLDESRPSFKEICEQLEQRSFVLNQ